jgi:hypothetical protein
MEAEYDIEDEEDQGRTRRPRKQNMPWKTKNTRGEQETTEAQQHQRDAREE